MLEGILAGSPGSALLVAVALTFLVAWESVYPRWAPYFLVYAVLAIAVPILAGTCRFGSLPDSFRGHLAEIALAGAAMAVWEIGIFHWLYETVFLRLSGRNTDPKWSVPAAIQSLLARAGEATGIPPQRAGTLFAGYTLLWAPLGENLFYWGYLFAVLRPDWGFPAATIVTSLLFAFRHAAHFLYFRKDMPILPALVLTVSALGSGLVNCLLYESVGSLWPLIGLHIGMNMLWILSMRMSGHWEAQ